MTRPTRSPERIQNRRFVRRNRLRRGRANHRRNGSVPPCRRPGGPFRPGESLVGRLSAIEGALPPAPICEREVHHYLVFIGDQQIGGHSYVAAQTDAPEHAPSRSADFAPRTHRAVHPTQARGIGRIVAIEEVVAGQVFKGRRTSLRAGSASQVFARSGMASGDKDADHRPEGSPNVGHAFKTHLPHKSSISLQPTPDKSSGRTRRLGSPGRIPGARALPAVLKTVAFVRSAILPHACYLRRCENRAVRGAQVAANLPPLKLGGASSPARQ